MLLWQTGFLLTANGVTNIEILRELLNKEIDLNRLVPNVKLKWELQDRAASYVCLFCLVKTVYVHSVL